MINQTDKNNVKLISLVKSIGFAFILTALFMLIFAGIMLIAGLSGMGISIMVILLSIIPVFVSGFYLGKKVEEKKYLWGMILAAAFFMIYLGIAVIFQADHTLLFGSYLKTFIIMLISGMLGGMLS